MTRITRILLFIGSLVAAFFLAEIGARIYMSVIGSSEEYTWEAASRWRGIHRLSDNPDLLYDLEPSSQIAVDYGRMGTVRYHISSQGMRDNEYAIPKPEGVVRILVLGDSVTFGYYVPVESTFVELTKNCLASQFQKVEILNAGVGGYNTHNEIAWFMEHGLRLEPDIIVLAFCPNDVDNPYFHFAWHTLDKLGSLPLQLLPDPSTMVGTRPETPSGLVVSLGRRFKVVFLIQQRLRILRNALDESAARKSGEEAEKALAQLPFGDCLLSLCEEGSPRISWLDNELTLLDSLAAYHRFRWGLLVLPVSYQRPEAPGLCARQALEDLAADHRIPFMNPLETPPASFAGLFLDVTHLSPAGHRWIAETLCRELEFLIAREVDGSPMDNSIPIPVEGSGW